MSRAFAPAADAFEKTLDELRLQGQLSDLGDLRTLGRRAALLAVAGEIWRQHLGPLLDTEQTMSLLQVKSRQAVSDLAHRGRLLMLGGAGDRKLYPAFQFAPNGRPWPDLPAILKIFADVVASPYTTASWLVSPNSSLDDETPIDGMRSGRTGDELLEAARRAASRLAR